MMRGTLDLVAIIVGIALGWEVAAQATTNATCTTDFWTYNQEQQSPCLVAASLQGACNAGMWSVQAIAFDQAYRGPNMGQSSPCQCSTVVYSVLSACAACQGALVDPWTDWKTNCSASDISLSKFPLSLPSGLTVPSWAYLDVTASGTWNPTASLNSHNSGTPDSSAGTPTSTTASSTTALSTSTSPTPSINSSKAPSHTGAIAGGVVGGVVGLALVACLWYMLLYRKRSGKTYLPKAKSINGEKVDLVGSHSPPPPSTPVPTYTSGPPMKFYDPDDPSTFPPTPSPSFFASVTSPTIESVLSPGSGAHSQAGSQSWASTGTPSLRGTQPSTA